jgi:hypothetical protein
MIAAAPAPVFYVAQDERARLTANLTLPGSP